MMTNVAGEDVATTCRVSSPDELAVIIVVVLNLLSKIESNSLSCSIVLVDIKLFVGDWDVGGVDVAVPALV